MAEERAAIEKRRAAAEENKANRQKAQDAAVPNENDDVLDTLLEKLRNGDTVNRRTRRNRSGADRRPSVPQSLNVEGETPGTADVARDMLARLQSDGFVTPASPTVAVSQRRRRLRDMASGDFGSPTSPLYPAEDADDGESEEEGTMDTPQPGHL